VKSEETDRWFLEAGTDTDRGWTVAVKTLPFTIGRDKDCDLKLNTKRVSRRHSEIRESGDHIWIRDLESTNGTYVNHVRIEQAELLKSGDLISVGDFNFYIKKTKCNSTSTVSKTISMEISEELNYLDSMRPKMQALLAERSVIPHFQPIVSLSDTTVLGYEILGRIGDGDLPSSPRELLKLSQWLGYENELSTLFREAGVEMGRKLPGTPILFVNAAPAEVYEMSAFLESLKKIHDIAPSSRVVIEIHEKTIDDKNEMAQLRDDLKNLNMGLAFDDFGVGQTRLVELANTAPDYLKFDISLIRQIHLAPKRLHQMISTFVKAAQDLGIATIAEGIESSEEADTCQNLGFNFAQGFFYGTPLPITEIQ